MGYLRRVRISGEKGASQGRQEKGAIVTAYVLYCFDARGVVVVQYSLSGVFCIVVVRYKPCTTKQRRKKGMEAKTSSQQVRS